MREPLRDRERLEHIIAAADNIARYTEGKTPKKVIIVPGKIINIVM